MLRPLIITMSPTQNDRCARLMRACEVYGAKCVDMVRHIRWVGSPFTAILACKLRPRTQKPHTQAIAADSRASVKPPAISSLTVCMMSYKPVLQTIFRISSPRGHNLHVYTLDLHIDCSAISGKH